MAEQKRIVIVAGPNGAGKTTNQGLVSSWVLYDNSGPTPRFLVAGDNP